MGLKETVISAVATAERAIGNLKIKGQLTRRTSAPYVPGQVPVPNTSVSPVSVVLTSYKTMEIDGDRIRASDILGLVFPNDVQMVPDTDDVIDTYIKDTTTISATYRVIYNDKVYAGDEVALSQLQLRLK
jgi:hypothetical protein